MRFAPILLVLIVGCTQGPAAPKGPAPVSDAEAVALAKAYVLNNHPGAKILKTGPNLGRKEMAALRREAFSEGDPMAVMFGRPMVRVKFQEKSVVSDQIVELYGKMAVLSMISASDDWIVEYRKGMAKMFPGIKVR